MALDIANIKKVLIKGLTAAAAPEILKGTLINFFKSKNLGVDEILVWVEEKRSLWDNIGPEHQEQMKRGALKIGNLDFLTVEWAIEGLRKEFPAVASLFLGWPKATNWLRRELENIKKQVLR